MASADKSSLDPLVYDKVEEALKGVVDPELDIDIINLGLIYDLSVDEDGTLIISMTLTSAGCPLTDVLEEQIDAVLKDITEIAGHRINWVWMPPWGVERITDEGREMMRALGFNF